MLKKIFLAIAVVIVILAIVIAMQPSEFRIERSATITAPPSAVFAQINDFHNWKAWSPWAKMDPTMHDTYSGAPSGKGATYAWEGNSKVGSGRMTMLESDPDLIRIQLEFLKPFAATNMAEFALTPAGSGTNVTWSMTGHNTFMFKAVGLFMNMDKMVGGDFERGLAQLKVESEAAAPRDTMTKSPAPVTESHR